MKKLLLSSVALLGLVSVASAADLPARTMAPAPAPVAVAQVFSWSGFYAGVSGGYMWNEADARFIGTTGFGGAAAAGAFPDFNLDSDGFIIGGQVGGNMQFGMFVAGIEADISYTDIGATNGFAYGGVPGVIGPRTTVVTSDLDFLGTVRGRLGLAFDRFMIYGTGGFAYGGTDNRGSVTFTGAGAGFPTLAGRVDDTSVGWAAGVGGEFAFTNNLTFKIEWLHYDLEDQRVAFANGAGADVTYRFRNEGDIVRGGINFKF